MTGEEIRRRLVDFVRKWSLYDASERAEAQTFLNELFACFRQGPDRRRGPLRRAAGGQVPRPDLAATVPDRDEAAERGTPAGGHREQALGYWRAAADPQRNLPAPRFVVLCAFQHFEIWEPGAYPTEPRASARSRPTC